MQVRLAIISDIHSNMEAFQQTLADIKNSGVDLIVNLGNSVGYPKHIITHFDGRRITYFGKKSVIRLLYNWGLFLEHITNLDEVRIFSIYHHQGDIWFFLYDITTYRNPQ